MRFTARRFHAVFCYSLIVANSFRNLKLYRPNIRIKCPDLNSIIYKLNIWKNTKMNTITAGRRNFNKNKLHILKLISKTASERNK